MKRLLIALLCASPLCAETPAITGMWVSTDAAGNIGDRDVTFQVTLGGGDTHDGHDLRVSCGLTEGRPATVDSANYTSAGWWMDVETFSSAVAVRWTEMHNLPPNDTIYCSLELSDETGTFSGTEQTCPVTCTGCTSLDDALFGDNGSGNSGWNCVTGENPRFITATETAGIPVDPTPPSHSMSLAVPAADNIHTVAADCSDRETEYGTAETAAESGNTAERVVLPAGGGTARCAKALTIRALTQGRVQFVGENFGTNLLPPEGTTLDLTHVPYLAHWGWDPDDPTDWNGNWITNATGANNTDFAGIYFGTPPHTQVDKISLAIQSVTGNTITLLSMPFVNGNIVFANFNGTGITSGHGPSRVCNIASLTLQLCAANGSTVKTLSGTYTSGGTIDLWLSQPITGHADCGDGEHCITVTGHGMGEHAQLTITGNSGAATITFTGVPSENDFDSTRAVMIRNSSDASCNGRWTYVSGSSGTMTLSGAGLDCSAATDGTVQVIDSVVVWATSDDTVGSLKKMAVWHWLVEDANTLRLVGSTADAGVTGGYITWEGQRINTTVAGNGVGGSQVTRNYRLVQNMAGCTFPWRCINIASMDASAQYVWANNLFVQDEWKRVDPISGDVQEQAFNGIGSGGNVGASFAFLNSDDVQWFANHHIGAGRGAGWYFSDSSDDPTTDHTFEKHRVYVRDTWAPEHPDFEGIKRDAADGFVWELKGNTDRVRWTGNYVKGQQTGFNNQAHVWALTGATGTVRDLELSWSTAERNSNGGLFLTDSQGDDPDQSRYPNARISVHDNLFVESSEKYEGNFTLRSGYCGLLWARMTDYQFYRNVCHHTDGDNGESVYFEPHRSQAVVITPNVFVASRPITSTRIGFRGGGTAGLLPDIPLWSTSAGSMFDATAVRGLTTDTNSSIDGNYLIPCIENSDGLADYAAYKTAIQSSDTSVRFTATELNALNEFTGITHAEVVDETTCLAGLNKVFQPGTWDPQTGYEDAMPDPRTLSDNQGWVWDIQLMRSATAARVTIEAPNTTACTVDLIPKSVGWFNSAGSIIRTTYSGGASKTQQVDIAGLSNVAYWGLVHCYGDSPKQFELPTI